LRITVNTHRMALKTLEYELPTLGLDSNTIFSYNLDDFVDKPLTGESENEWNLKEFWDNYWDTFFDNNDPQSAVMTNKDVSQTVIATNSEYDIDSAYLNTSAFLSPVSLAPSSPSQLNDDTFEKTISITDEIEPDFVNNESAIELFKLLMSNSNNSSIDSEDVVDYVNDNAFIDNNVCHEEVLSYTDKVVKTEKIRGKRKSTDSDSTSTSTSTSDTSSGKRRKKAVVPTEIKKERKKFQNKSAANRYRMKKRVEHETVELEKDVVLKQNEELKQTLEKLQMEYKVVHPLAEAAFASDSKRKLLLQMLHIRVLNNNVLD